MDYTKIRYTYVIFHLKYQTNTGTQKAETDPVHAFKAYDEV